LERLLKWPFEDTNHKVRTVVYNSNTHCNAKEKRILSCFRGKLGRGGGWQGIWNGEDVGRGLVGSMKYYYVL